MNHTLLAWELLEDSLMNEPLRPRRLVAIVWIEWRCVLDIIFVEVIRRAYQRRWLIASHKEGSIIERIPNADMAKARHNLIVVQDMVCSDQKRKGLSEIGYHLEKYCGRGKQEAA